MLEATTEGTHESRYAYELDGAGNRKSQQVALGAKTGGTLSYFDYSSGNVLECRMKAHEACSKSSASEISGYSYDGAGNETAITGYNDPASTAFSYNNLNQLKSLTPPCDSGTSGQLPWKRTGRPDWPRCGCASEQPSRPDDADKRSWNELLRPNR